MQIGTMQIKVYTVWVNSLKEKRSIVKSLTTKIINKFNVSVCEIADNDVHKTITLGIAFVVPQQMPADSIFDKILNYTQSNTEGEITSIIRDVITF